jgi:hypothetical protein
LVPIPIVVVISFQIALMPTLWPFEGKWRTSEDGLSRTE